MNSPEKVEDRDRKIVLAECERCGRPLRVRVSAVEGGISLRQHLTCKCGHSNSLAALTRSFLAREVTEEMAAVRDAVMRGLESETGWWGRKKRTVLLAALYHQRGLEHAAQGRLEEASEDLGKAAELAPEDEAVRQSRDSVLDALAPQQIEDSLRRGDARQAIFHMLTHCSRHPEDTETRSALARLLHGRALGAAGLAQSLRSGSTLDRKERELLEDLRQDAVFGMFGSEPTARNALLSALANIALARGVHPENPEIRSHFDDLARMAEAMGLSYKEYRRIVDPWRSIRLDADPQKRPKGAGLAIKWVVLGLLGANGLVLWLKWDEISEEGVSGWVQGMLSISLEVALALFLVAALNFGSALIEGAVSSVSDWLGSVFGSGLSSGRSSGPSYASRLPESPPRAPLTWKDWIGILLAAFLVASLLAFFGIELFPA